MTPEKLAIMKLSSSSHLDGDVFSDPETPAKSVGFHSRAENKRSSLSRSSRQVSSSRRASSFMHSHRNKMSLELQTQAESKFFVLIELMSNASREASSLKEYWSRLMADRESFDKEREELMLQIDEVNETLEQKESQQHNHGRELHERKKEIEKLLIELSAAINGVSEQKKKVADKDQEIERIRTELSDFRLSTSRSQIDFDNAKAELESIVLRLKTAEGERDHAREDIDKARSELRIITREHTDVKARYTDITSKLDVSRQEVQTLTDRIKAWESERTELLVEKDRLQEQHRKISLRVEDTSRELTEVTEKYERLQRDHKQAKDTIRFIESERDDHATTIDRLRLEIRTKVTANEEVEARLADIVLKFEQSKRESIDKDGRLHGLESEIHELRQRLERSQENHRTVIVERDQLRDDVESERRRVSDTHRQLTTLQETLTRTESLLSDVRTEVYSTTERIKHIEHERDDLKDKNHHLHGELSGLKEKLALLQAEIRTTTEARDQARHELEQFKQRYDEVTETITEYNNDSGELEFEIESLRTMLREAREQKERAITARAAADRERDEFVAKYEDKCREMEKWEESRSSWFHSHGRGEGRTVSSRTVTRNGASSSSYSKHEGGEGIHHHE
ncbi:hypothetical protein M409DRAFT_65449 [Zasmidium cellare ATCC 36951]|uniref:Uncharacterized protein n=1 Tax=Zasmidium cellare ATCC 36951 TaxID=1080233 RepID=A0A6A6CQM6_ZASCE|nr:uncharacterized protein M409DRAFT_65449 [Zasmidium cellare ATCC 36951]KAF2168498.1 hypothetical protein M409DRAFT_65449 [Zasmidium cellare ATCC 36951]